MSLGVEEMQHSTSEPPKKFFSSSRTYSLYEFSCCCCKTSGKYCLIHLGSTLDHPSRIQFPVMGKLLHKELEAATTLYL